MDPEDVVALYYDAWISKRGDMSGVPLAPDFTFHGPTSDFNDAESYREMAVKTGAMITSFTVRQQFTDGNQVCSIIDWKMALAVAPLTSAEILEVRNGQITSSELIFDAQELRAAMAAGS